MEAIDIGILLFLSLGLLHGFRKGFFYQLASLLGLWIGLYIAKTFYLVVAEKLCPTVFDSMTFAQIVSFIGIWLVVPIAFSLVASFLSYLFKKLYLGWLNRMVGALMGLIKYIVLLSLLLCLFDFFDSDNQIISKTKKQESVLYKPVKTVVKIFFYVVKDSFPKETASPITKVVVIDK